MVMHGVVPKFEGEYSFLSNFYETPFTWRGDVWPTAEHAFQGAKVFCLKDGAYIEDIERDLTSFRTCPTPGEAKKLGQRVKLDVEAWNARRVMYMREVIHAKFMTSEESLVGPLINTGAMMLVEGNDWGDTFWGRCNGKGFNTLGVILMETRGYWLHHKLVCPTCKHVL